ncbi:hypothetical protein FA15DRAFT_709600 [Coprinopsis marcescibilis]|uniref:Uncharacterized protein n=1 Tax=Coprinopsis marcescibilis TaxID=230819 RepID=A0A5C3KFB9_COPMA|nr:hypothetical protein FA15DRAFT_709600 [Coprinopsis marcescibilis]
MDFSGGVQLDIAAYSHACFSTFNHNIDLVESSSQCLSLDPQMRHLAPSTTSPQCTTRGFERARKFELAMLSTWRFDTSSTSCPLPTVESTKPPTKPSSHNQPKNYIYLQFHSPTFFLTQTILEAPIVVSRDLNTVLNTLEEADGTYDMKENVITRRVVVPFVNILRCIFETRLHITDYKWHVSSCSDMPNDENLETDVALSCKQTAPPRPPSKLAFIMEMKTPKSTNHSDMVDLPVPAGSKTKTTRRIISQVGKHGEYLAGLYPKKRFVIYALSVVPAHLFPCALDGSKGNMFALGTDIVGLLDTVMSDSAERSHIWLSYFDKVGALVFAVLYDHDQHMRDVWGEGSSYEEQVQQFKKLMTAAGKALQPTPTQVILTFVHTLLIAIQKFTSLPMLLLLTQLRTLSLAKTLKQPDIDPITLDPTFAWRPLLGLTLFPPCSTHVMAENIVYIYANLAIVIKLFSKEEMYRNKLACYKHLIDLQGRGIPVVLSTGVCEADDRRCLVLSHEGERVHDLSDNDKAALQPLVDAIHGKGLHHHDLHERNVVHNLKG